MFRIFQIFKSTNVDTLTVTSKLFRFYDVDEVPKDLEDRVQSWADAYGTVFDIEQYDPNRNPKLSRKSIKPRDVGNSHHHHGKGQPHT